MPGSGEEADRVADDTAETVSIELDFNAFADDTPPTQHARRIARLSDPSVQDFADQALELATLRAELKRLDRDYQSLQNTLRIRELRVQELRNELSMLRARQRDTPREMHIEAPAPQEVSSTLPLPEPETTAVIPDTPPAAPAAIAAPSVASRRLIPLDDEGEAIALCRDIMTIGRTRGSDICISSRAVSRDHARLVMSQRGVTVFDMHSANGCFVNDEPVKRHKLRDGDVLRIGDRSYRFAS